METFQMDVLGVAQLELPWEKLRNKTVLITGATGMIGTFLTYVLLSRKEHIRLIAISRNVETAQKRFKEYWYDDNFTFICHDINLPLDNIPRADFVIHAASNTHPVAYATDPIGTITTNVIGTYNMLEFSAKTKAERFLFTSSVEIYGENRGDIDYFDENYCGYINCNTVRAGYPESKRTGEALCQAYRKARNLNVVIARLARTYGPTLLLSDTKAISQFIRKGTEKQDIVLKSDGNQIYSYSYVADAVAGLLTVLLKGENGEAYNIADPVSDISLKEIANMIAGYVGTKVIYEIPDSVESSGYSNTVKAIMSSKKLQGLGWTARYSIKDGIKRTLDFVDCWEHLK